MTDTNILDPREVAFSIRDYIESLFHFQPNLMLFLDYCRTSTSDDLMEKLSFCLSKVSFFFNRYVIFSLLILQW